MKRRKRKKKKNENVSRSKLSSWNVRVDELFSKKKLNIGSWLCLSIMKLYTTRCVKGFVY